MSDLEEFVKKSVIKGRKEIKMTDKEIAEMQLLLRILDEKPKKVYRTYTTTNNR